MSWSSGKTKTDKGCFGGTWRVVLAENEDAAAKIGWQPMSVDQGFQAGDNVVTVASCTSTDSIFAIGEEKAEKIQQIIQLNNILKLIFLYSKDQIMDAINNCKINDYHKENNYQYCTPEFFSRAETLDKYSNVTKQNKIVYASHTVIFD